MLAYHNPVTAERFVTVLLLYHSYHSHTNLILLLQESKYMQYSISNLDQNTQWIMIVLGAWYHYCVTVLTSILAHSLTHSYH